MIEKRVLVSEKSRHYIYEFLKDPRNYMSGVSGINVDSVSASGYAPGIGDIEARLTNLVDDKKIVFYSKEINTAIEAILEDTDNSKTKVNIVIKSDPDCGFFKNLAIKLAIPNISDLIVDNLCSFI